MSQLKQKYNQIMALRTGDQTSEQVWQITYDEKTKSLLSLFKEAFSDVIPLLEADGIEINAHYQDTEKFQAPYIQFKLGNKTLWMDFCGLDHYRFQSVEFDVDKQKYTYQGKVLGSYPQDDFIVWLTEHLILPPDPASETIMNDIRPQSIKNHALETLS